MQIVIDIDKKEYEEALRGYFNVIAFNEAVKHSTPLPKGHGRLVDINEAEKILENNTNLNNPMEVLGSTLTIAFFNTLKTVIEADKVEGN